MLTVRRNLLILLVVVILIGVAGYFIYPASTSTRLGLDLQGGLAVILEAEDTPRAPRTEEGMTQTLSVIQDRVDRLGVTEPEIQRQGEWKVSVQLPGVENPQDALDIIGRTAVLEFYDTDQFGESHSSEDAALEAAGVESESELPADLRLVYWPSQGAGSPERWFLVEEEPLMTGAALEGAQVGFDDLNVPKVDLEFRGEGADRFAEITEQMAQEGQVTGTDQLLAIVLDGIVQSAPRVQERIGGGRAEITGQFSLDEAQDLALVLQTGALPIQLEVIEQRSVGATLGQQSLGQALYAGAAGLVLVLVFMLLYYRVLGLIADIALVVYGLLFWGVLSGIGATLTLPGIAGIILTLGMAVDANVIIFARIREEARGGKTIRTAIDAGFRKGLRTILDANITTILVAIVLFWAATGGVRGFALTLGIGVALSMFTAIVVTRSLLGVLAGWRAFQVPSVLGLRVHKLEERSEGSA